MAQKVFNFVLAAKTSGFNNVNLARRGLSAFNREVREGDAALGAMQSKMSLVSGAALGLVGMFGAGFGIQSMITDVTAGARELEIFSRTAGMSAGNFATYAHAVKTVGLEADKLADISKDVKDKVGDYLETGGGEFADFFENVGEKAGLAAEELIKLSGPEALIAVKRAMDEVGISTENQVFYLESLANDASLLIPLLEDEGKKLKELALRAEEMGVAISDLDHQKLLELDEVLREFQQHLGVVTREIVLALAPTIKDMAQYFKENKEEVRELAVEMAGAAGATVRWLIENRALVADVAKLVVGLWAVSKALKLITVAWGGANAAALAMTGSRLLPWLSSLMVGMRGATVAATSLNAAMAAGVVWWSGSQVHRATKEFISMREAQNQAKAAADRLSESQARLAKKLKEISEETGVSINSSAELHKAVEDGVIHLDRATGTWKRGAKEMGEAVQGVAEATADSFEAQEKVSDEKLKEMEQAYQRYVDQVKNLQEQIAGREKSLAAELREMSRSGMSELGAWKDRQKEADEYYVAAEEALAMAKKALAEGDEGAAEFRFKEAQQYADEAKAAYRELNGEVKDGDKVLISQKKALQTAMSGVEESGRLAIKILGEQKEAARAAAEELNNQSGGKLGTEHLKELNGLTVEYQQEVKKATKHWETQWETVEKDGKRVLKTIAGEIDKLSGKTIDVYIKRIETKAAGGLAGIPGLAAGGSPWMYFPRYSSPHITRGAGGVDDVPTLLMRNEYVQPVAAVQKYGLRFMELIRRGLFPVELARGFASGGTPAGAVSLGPAGGGAGLPPMQFHFHGAVPPATQQNARQLARQVMAELQKMYGSSS